MCRRIRVCRNRWPSLRLKRWAMFIAAPHTLTWKHADFPLLFSPGARGPVCWKPRNVQGMQCLSRCPHSAFQLLMQLQCGWRLYHPYPAAVCRQHVALSTVAFCRPASPFFFDHPGGEDAKGHASERRRLPRPAQGERCGLRIQGILRPRNGTKQAYGSGTEPSPSRSACPASPRPPLPHH